MIYNILLYYTMQSCNTLTEDMAGRAHMQQPMRRAYSSGPPPPGPLRDFTLSEVWTALSRRRADKPQPGLRQELNFGQVGGSREI